MKKALSVFLACLMLFGCLAFSAAAEGEPGNYDSDLLALWDFEGAKPFANKAPNGANVPLQEVAPNAEGTNANTSASGVIPVSDGVATVSGETYYSLYLTAARRKVIMPNETSNIYNKTYFAKFKGGDGTVKTGTGLQAVFGHRSHEFSLIFLEGSDKTDFGFVFSHLSDSGIVRETLNKELIPTPVDGEWYYAALSVGDHDAENKILPVDILLSNNGKDYAVFHYDINASASTLSTSFSNCYWNFGKCVHTSKSNGGMDILFDEIAIYDCTLTANELALHTLGFKAPASDIAIVGHQTTTPANDLFNVRFVGTINNVENYKEVGFTVLFSNALGTTKTVEITSTTVYLSLNATDASGNTYTAISAAAGGVDALFALRVEDIPVVGTYTVTIIGTALTTSDELVNTNSYTYRLVNGVFTPAA